MTDKPSLSVCIVKCDIYTFLFAYEGRVSYMEARQEVQLLSDLRLLEKWLDVYISEDKQRGFVATLDLSKIKHKGAYTKFWSLDEKEMLLQLTDGARKPLTNVYLSLNAFEQDAEGKIYRRVKNLAQIRNIGIDLDCYKIGLSPDETIERLKQMIFDGTVPNPNLVIHSGNGIQLVYGIYRGLPPTAQMKWLVMDTTKQLTEYFTALGADFNAISLERVFRLPGTFNVKPGRSKKLTRAEIWSREEYSINDLRGYCKPYERRERVYKPQKEKGKVKTLPLLKTQGNTLRALNTARLGDFLKLIDLRKGNIDNRNVLTYDYAFTLGLTGISEQGVIVATLQVNDLFNDPQPVKEATRTAKSGYEDACKYWEAYKANDYCQIGLDRRLIKPKRNTTLIRHHAITEEEQEHLATVIGKEESYNRKVEKRRKNGMRTMKQYNDERMQQKLSKIGQLKELMEQHPNASQRKLADLMGVGKSTLNRLIKGLK